MPGSIGHLPLPPKKQFTVFIHLISSYTFEFYFIQNTCKLQIAK
ncbi:hypothetical protein SAMN05720758_1420 [Fibrobacter sp. UWB11]|nr:hypothetical protein SAMN05720758_1420 [Fibrobacter sp. UWB11]